MPGRRNSKGATSLRFQNESALREQLFCRKNFRHRKASHAVNSCVWGAFPGAGFLADGALEAAVDEALAATGTAQYAQSYVDDLSGGERQRVWISMLLAQASPVMILDEPTSALDVRHQYGTLALLERLNRETGRGVIAIIHDINLALRFATHIVALKEGKVLFSGGAELLHSEENLRTLFEAPVKLMLHPDPPAAYTGGKKQLPLDVAVVCE